MPANRNRHVRYPELYTWLVFVSALDLIFTYLILYTGGREMNGVASRILNAWGFNGMIAYKFAIVGFIILLCEVIGRRHHAYGRLLGMIGVTLTCVPVGIAAILLTARVHHLV